MENTKIKDTVGGMSGVNGYYYMSKDGKTIAINAVCPSCERNYYQKWVPRTHFCAGCTKTKELTKRVQELEEQLQTERKTFEEALAKSQEWHERDLEAKVEQKVKEITKQS